MWYSNNFCNIALLNTVMAGNISHVHQEVDNTHYEFTEEELKTVQYHISKYPDKQSAVMPVLWMAQEKYGWLSDGAIQLVADTLGLSFAHVYGVATFYTMYFKRKMGKYLLEICTCLTCGICGGPEAVAYAKKKIQANEDGVSPDGLFWVREAECLGACDTAPVMQFNNGHYVHNVDSHVIDKIVDDVRNGKLPEFVSIPLRDQSIIDD